MTAPADPPRPAELLDARHDGPDLTGPLVDFETHNAPADPLLETIAKAVHENTCLMRHDAHPNARCNVTAVAVLAALSAAGYMLYGKVEDNDDTAW